MAAANGFPELCGRLAALTDTDAASWHLTFKARQAMEVAFRAILEAGGRREVVTSPFTCVTAIDPILSCGLTPRYADVSGRNLAIDLDTAAICERTAAVVLQHTFGIIDAEADAAIVRAAHKVGALVVEDNAHCIARLSTTEDKSPLADVSIHSFGVEKMLPGVYFGGACWVNPALDERLREPLERAFRSLPGPERSLAAAAPKYRNQMRLLTRVPAKISERLRDVWARRGTFEPAVADAERRGRLSREASLPSEWVAAEDLKALATIDENEAMRRACVEAYLGAWGTEEARRLGVPEAIVTGEVQPLLRMPVFLRTTELAEEAISRVGAMGLYAQAWPRPLLIPGVHDLAAFGIESFDAWPTAKRLSAGVVALPTDCDPSLIEGVAKAISELARR